MAMVFNLIGNIVNDPVFILPRTGKPAISILPSIECRKNTFALDPLGLCDFQILNKIGQRNRRMQFG